jgi:elongator complex protein 3
MPRAIASAIIEASIKEGVQTKDAFFAVSRKVCNAEGVQMPDIPTIRQTLQKMVDAGEIPEQPLLNSFLVRRDVRTMSGVAIITVLTKPYPCPGKCVYCPTEAIMPKSYLSNEPAAMRALVNEFDPFDQVWTRLETLSNNGHATDKIELIVKGGTWSAYAWEYQQWFIRRCFDAANSFGLAQRDSSRTLAEAQDKNEIAGHRIIGLTIETRPDWISVKEIIRLRTLGVTRVELGVQSVDDRMLEITKRGHDVASVRRAAQLLRDAGYKTDFHMMPQLPLATPESDLAELKLIFDDPDFRPDMIKIYPCVVVELAELYDWWKDGTYKPYPDSDLLEMLIKAKQYIPRYCRISRLIRDIPGTSIVAGNMITNLREEAQKEMKKRGVSCKCLRCREIGRMKMEEPALATAEPVLFDDTFEASHGEEHFLSMEDSERKAVFAFCRLRLPPKQPIGDSAELWQKMEEIQGAAFIRELHTYDKMVRINTHIEGVSQHTGLGRALMQRAEDIARNAGYKKLAVISGIGVREYYRKLGYETRGTYMVKDL